MMTLWDRLPLAKLLLRGNGRLDWVRRVIVVVSVGVTSVMLLTIAAVLQIDTTNGPYSSELLQNPSFRWGLVFGLIFISMPIAFILGQASRIASPGRAKRDERLQLAGAPRALLVRLAVGEAAVLGVVGFAVGVCFAEAARRILGDPRPGSYQVHQVLSDRGGLKVVQITTKHGDVLSLPTDVSLSVESVVACLLAAVCFSLCWTLVAISDKAPIKRVGSKASDAVRKARNWIPIFAVGAFVIFSFNHPGTTSGSAGAYLTLAFVGLLAIVVLWIWIAGSMLLQRGAGWLASTASGPVLLMGLRRMQADASSAARATYASVAVLTVVGFALGTKQYILAVSSNPADGSTQALKLVDLALVVTTCCAVGMVGISLLESIPRQRREWARLIGAGVPLSSLRTSLLVEGVTPMILLGPGSLMLGAVGSRVFFGGRYSTIDASTGATLSNHVPWPWVDVFSLSAAAVAVVGISSLVVGFSAGVNVSAEEVKASY